MKRISSPRPGFERRERQSEFREEITRQMRLIILEHFRTAIAGDNR